MIQLPGGRWFVERSIGNPWPPTLLTIGHLLIELLVTWYFARVCYQLVSSRCEFACHSLQSTSDSCLISPILCSSQITIKPKLRPFVSTWAQVYIHSSLIDIDRSTRGSSDVVIAFAKIGQASLMTISGNWDIAYCPPMYTPYLLCSQARLIQLTKLRLLSSLLAWEWALR